MAVVAPLLDVLARVVVRAAVAGVVNQLAVREERPPLRVEVGPAAEGEVVDDDGGDVLGVRRAARKVDDVPRVRDGLGDADRAGRIRMRRRQAAERSAVAERDRRRGAAADFTRDVERGAAVDEAIAGLHRDRALDERDGRSLRLREQLERGCEGWAVAAAGLEGEGDDRRLVRARERLGHDPGRQRERGADGRAERHELAPGDIHYGKVVRCNVSCRDCDHIAT